MLWPTACCGDRTGQVSQCSRSDAGGTCKVVPDERSALETEIARLQDVPVPLVSGPRHRTYGTSRSNAVGPQDKSIGSLKNNVITRIF